MTQLLERGSFSVYVPLMFGVAGQDDFFAGLRQACSGRLFYCSTAKGSREHPITPFIAALTKDVCAGGLCGVIGVCLTGTLPLTVLRSSANIKVAVLAQPSLPLTTKFWSGALVQP